MLIYICREFKRYRSDYSTHFRDNFQNWTSGDNDIDKLIQDSQLNANDPCELLEWIEYWYLKNIEHIAEGGFGSVFKTIWKDGPTTYGNRELDKKNMGIQRSEWA